MSDGAIEAALAIARARHDAIARGDLEGYSSRGDELAAACAVLAGAPAGYLTVAHIPALDELVALETQSRSILEGMMPEASSRLDSLRQSERANAAYLRNEQHSVTGA